MDATEEEDMVFVNGVDECEPVVTLRLDKMTKGEYFVLYRPDFKEGVHVHKRLNLVFYSEF